MTSDLQKLAYNALTGYFQQHEDEVVEIEILPPAIEPPGGILMQDGLNLGLPKKTLVLAFSEARQVFFSNIPVGDDYQVRHQLSVDSLPSLFKTAQH